MQKEEPRDTNNSWKIPPDQFAPQDSMRSYAAGKGSEVNNMSIMNDISAWDEDKDDDFDDEDTPPPLTPGLKCKSHPSELVVAFNRHTLNYLCV